MLPVAQSQAERLRSFLAVPKFVPVGLYSGAKPESLRVSLESHVNALADRIIARLPLGLSKDRALAEFKVTLHAFDGLDSEEQDHVCLYIEQIMDILEIESSDGLLNNWRYGFDPSDKDA